MATRAAPPNPPRWVVLLSRVLLVLAAVASAVGLATRGGWAGQPVRVSVLGALSLTAILALAQLRLPPGARRGAAAAVLLLQLGLLAALVVDGGTGRWAAAMGQTALPSAAANLALAALAAALTVPDRWRRTAVALTGLADLIGYVSLVAWAYRVDPTTTFERELLMGPAAATAVLVTGLLLVQWRGLPSLVTAAREDRAVRAVLFTVAPVGLVAPVVFGWILVAAQTSGLLTSRGGVTLLVASYGLLALVVVAVGAAQVRRIGAQRRQAYEELAQAKAGVDDQVVGATAELSRSRDLYRAVTEALAEGVMVLDEDGTVLLANPAAAAILGLEQAAVLGGSWRGPHAFTTVDADLAPLPLERWPGYRALATDRAVDEEEMGVRSPDGRLRWLRVRAAPITTRPGVRRLLTIYRDVTAETEARRSLEASEERFRLSMANAPVGMALVALDGRFLEVNEALAQMLGRSEQELRTVTTVADVTHPEDLADDLEQHARLLAGEIPSYRLDKRYCRPDGALVWGELSVSLVRADDGQPAYLVAQVRDVTAVRSAQEELAWLAYHDALTGAANRERVREDLDAALARARRDGSRVAVLYCDLDHFKVVNDSFGHQVGDGLLREVSTRVRQAVPVGATVGRMGGDEFVVVLAPADVRLALASAAAIDQHLRGEITVAGRSLTSTVSTGVVVVAGDASAEEALRDADFALYRAKAEGRARWALFDEGMRRDAVARMVLEEQLRRALERDELVVHYEPVVALPGGTLVGLEALVRWRHPDRGLLSPAEFLGLAEESGHIAALGRRVLDRACSLLARRTDPDWYVAVNVSAVQLGRADFVPSVRAALDRHGCDPSRLVLEITESGVLHLSASARRDLVALTALGLRLFVDDFGTGFSSVSHLRDLPVSGLKLDQSFVVGLTVGDSPANRLAEGLSGLARGLGLVTVAEGVETVEQAETLARLGWSCAQGELYGRAAPEEDLGLDVLAGRAPRGAQA